MKISDINFTDLYIYSNGDYFVKNKTVIIGVDIDESEIVSLRDQCDEKYKAGMDEFRVSLDDCFLRVTTIEADHTLYVLKKSQNKVRDFYTLGFNKPTTDFLLGEKSSGLVLIGGEMNSGKTTSAATIIQERLKVLGGVAVAIEDPPEIFVQHTEKGKFIQVHAHDGNGGYPKQLRLSLRTGANFILIGEIRATDTAHEVINAAMNGCLVISTIHGESISRVVERLYSYSEGYYKECIKDALRVVMHQKLTPIDGGNKFRLKCQSLTFDSECRSAMDERKFSTLDEIMSNQAKAFVNNRDNSI